MLTATANWMTATVTDVTRLVNMTLPQSGATKGSIIIRYEIDGLLLFVMALPTAAGVWSWVRGA